MAHTQPTTTLATASLQASPLVQRATVLQRHTGIVKTFELDTLRTPRRLEMDAADWWLYPAHLDYALYTQGAIPVRAVHWPTLASVARYYDSFAIAHEMPKGAEFVESMALAPAGFVQADKPAKWQGITFAPFAPGNSTTAYVSPGQRLVQGIGQAAAALDPILFGLISQGRRSIYFVIAEWTWRL